MIKGLLRAVKRKIQKTENIASIFDDYTYSSKLSSYCGNSLKNSKILCISNLNMGEEIRILIAKECDNIGVHYCREELAVGSMERLEEEMEAKFDVIVNIIQIDDYDEQNIAEYNEVDGLRLAYQWNQIETDYLLSKKKGSHVCTVVIGNDSLNSDIVCACVESCIKGLGLALGNHGIISNGAIVGSKVPMEEIIKAVCYLCSKYGQILAGEVLRLK